MTEERRDALTESGVQRALKRNARDIAVDFLFKNFKAVVGFLIGCVTAYLTLRIQVNDALHAATQAKEATVELKQAIGNLATRDQVEAQKERIDELVDWRLTFTEDVKEARKLAPHLKRRH